MKEEYSTLRYYCRAPLYEFALGFKEFLRLSNPPLGREVLLTEAPFNPPWDM